MKEELSKTYNPTEFESDIYTWWEQEGFFKPEKQRELGITNDKSESFCITIPPPNVTGVLHLGHAIIISIQDLMIRYERMRGKETVFIPGSDHAGIATQNVVERELNKQGIERKELGREKFVDKVWEWKEKSHSIIVKQSKKMGLSTDWDRERFTLDDQLSRAVREAFITLYKQDLIYRDSYLINWCPGRCESAISDLEAIPEEVDSHLWYFKYPVTSQKWRKPRGEWGSGEWAKDAEKFIELATTRPETLLGDTAVATSRKHPKFGKLIGKYAILPVLGRKIPIIEDESVDAEFGTGALKITPAHDFTDYETGQRHNLEMITVLDEKSRILEEYGGKYAGMDRFEARKAIVEDLKKEGLLVKIEPYRHSVPHCERCHTVVEPRNSTQWFVRTQPMAQKVLKLLDMEQTNFVPNKFDERFRYWMENNIDWCISRQLWWGHRIPIWYCNDCDEMSTGREDPTTCSGCGGSNIYQDEDVLDTWFSSGLWPFSTLGWPDNTTDLARFYPNTTRETGYDILLFWVAREMMMGAQLTNQLPYKNIYFHGLIRNEAGRKISKSMENIDEYDPLLIIEKFGADTLRYTLVSYSTPGLDMNLDPKNIEATHRFGNKIWQATRFLLGNLQESYAFSDIKDVKINELELTDQWILSQLHQLIRDVTKNFEEFNYLDAGRELKRFFWNSFADWYIEISKLRIYGDETEKFNPIHIILHVLDSVFRMLHPFMPFLTEKLWAELPSEFHDQEALIIASWPQFQEKFINEQINEQFDLIIQLIIALRRIRGEFKVKPSKKIPLILEAGKKTALLREVVPEIIKLAMIDENKFTLMESIVPPKKSVTDLVDDLRIYIPLEGLVEIDEEINRLKKEITKLEKQKKGIEGKLRSEFVNRAPENLVQQERDKLDQINDTIDTLSTQMNELSQ
ncbi:MAG: valine--tRNA ligase [Candidatus Heimdallarchaeota archaeon]|nr:valine--tRNA ligase [Candidatus Heimdallarchaeota archaeon]